MEKVQKNSVNSVQGRTEETWKKILLCCGFIHHGSHVRAPGIAVEAPWLQDSA
jgi:hypothetical protein